MDNLKEYIKMCEKAKKIQKLCPFKCRKANRFSILPMISYDENNVYYINNIEKADVWLPRQDQLQEIVRNNAVGSALLYRFSGWVENNISYLSHYNMRSMEQLWLAFVMQEKYNKIWNGKDWVNDGGK